MSLRIANVSNQTYFEESGTVTAAPIIVDLSQARPPYTFIVSPGNSNTSKLEISITPTAVTDPNNAVWVEWPFSAVSVATETVYSGRLNAVRFTRVSGTSTDRYEVLA